MPARGVSRRFGTCSEGDKQIGMGRIIKLKEHHESFCKMIRKVVSLGAAVYEWVYIT